jgi:hypothetical protein
MGIFNKFFYKNKMIPKIIHQIWIGDKPAPNNWMNSWKNKHQEWKYILWDNEKIKTLDIINKKQFNFYWNQKRWHGVSDILRYEILYKFGGVMPEGDHECINPIDELFNEGDCFAVVNDCGKFNDPVDLTFKDANISPLLACNQGNKFAKILIDEIGKKERLGKPWIFTGNNLMKEMILLHKPEIKIFPSFYFVPEYQNGNRYQGNHKIYAEHHWGTTRKCYNKGVKN